MSIDKKVAEMDLGEGGFLSRRFLKRVRLMLSQTITLLIM